MLGSSLLEYLGFSNLFYMDSEHDITNPEIVLKTLNKIKPDIIIHTAAYTDVEACEVNIDKAYKVNSLGTQNLVNYCIDKDVLFIYISSTGIYGTSKKEAYTEFDQVKPTTIHHKSKYEGEITVQNHLSKYLILRTGWLYGGEKTHAKNFVYKRYLEASNTNVIYSDNSQIGNPTHVIDFIRQMKVLIDNSQYGIFNCINEAICISRFDYVSKIIELFDLNCEVKAAPERMFKRVAPVSTNESAINYKLNLLGMNIMRNWEVPLNEYIQQLKSEL